MLARTPWPRSLGALDVVDADGCTPAQDAFVRNKSARNFRLCRCGGSNRRGFVVKLSGAMDTRDRGPGSELIASRLALHFGILHPQPAAIRLHPGSDSLAGATEARVSESGKFERGVEFRHKVAIGCSNRSGEKCLNR